mmetsp:Transcript_134141/g.258186  ORF Transcript_134141/g.258186 Transcript_134141/m.258186 type:complete len:214 (+) Transcript_134141:764-1405(+)
MTVSSASFLPLSAEICTLRLATASLRTWSISVRNTLHDCSSFLSMATQSPASVLCALSTMRATSERSRPAFSKPSSSILRHIFMIFTSMLSTMRMISAWPLPASSRPPVRSFPISSSHAIRSFASCSSCFCKSVVTDLTSCRAVCTHCSVTVSLCLSVRAADSLLISSAKRSNSDCILLPSSASPAALDFTSFSNKLRVRASVELIRFSSSSV